MIVTEFVPLPVALAEIVIAVALVMFEIVAPPGMFVPEMFMPVMSPAVLVNPVRFGEPLTVVADCVVSVKRTKSPLVAGTGSTHCIVGIPPMVRTGIQHPLAAPKEMDVDADVSALP